MIQFYNEIKSLISPELISKASSLLGEDEKGISKAITSIVPGFLGLLLNKGNDAKVRNILEEAGNLDILSNVKGLWDGKPSQEQQKVGDNFLEELLGDRAANFTDSISSFTGISKIATNKLISTVAPIVAGVLGSKLVKENLSFHSILKGLDKEKSIFTNLIPSSIVNSFGLSSLFEKPLKKVENTVETAALHKSNSWLKWLLPLIALVLLFFWWKSCQDKKGIEVANINVVDTIQSKTGKAVNRIASELTLPDGVKINKYDGGIEEAMLKFLQSDDYKKATAKDLEGKWFKFDNIDFEFGSSTQLTADSKVQIDNLIAILKNFKDVKIDIGAFADKKGDSQANSKISEDRAQTVKALFNKGGVGAQVVSAKGYGDQFAKHSASETDEQRAEDRNIALRFLK